MRLAKTNDTLDMSSDIDFSPIFLKKIDKLVMYGAHIQLNIFTMILYYCYGALLELRRRDLEMVPVMQDRPNN